MPQQSTPFFDDTPLLLLEGYAWLPALRRHAPDGVAVTRLMGRRAFGLCGPEAARFVYDENNVQRHDAIPGTVRATLFGNGGVHSLDGERHRLRKSLFASLMAPESIAALVDRVGAAWDETVLSWAGKDHVILFDEASRVLTRGVCEWARVPLTEGDVDSAAADMVALVDGFATLGPRQWRGRHARRRRESWLLRLIEEVRRGGTRVPEGSPVEVAALHRDIDGGLLDPHTAAVELLNVIRPTVAVCWFVTFAAHALRLWPENRDRLANGDPAFTEAFVDEVRRFYPFAPFVGGRAVRDLAWLDHDIPAGSFVLLDIYGQNHDPGLWPDPYSFVPDRFLARRIGPYDFIPQGAGDPATGHRCPGEDITVALLSAITTRLARLDYDVPKQDLTISLRRIPARPKSGFVLSAARPALHPLPTGRAQHPPM
jgi:fatty-acid peroxygenase